MLNQISLSQFVSTCVLSVLVTACGTTRSFDPSIYGNHDVRKIKLDITPELRVMGSGGSGAAVAVFGLVGAAIVSASNQSAQRRSRSGLQQVAKELKADEINKNVMRLVDNAFEGSLYPVYPTFVKSSNVHFNTFGVSLKYGVAFSSDVSQLHSEILFISNLGKGTQSIRSYQSIFSVPDKSTDRNINFEYWTKNSSAAAKDAVNTSFAELEQLMKDDLAAKVKIQSDKPTVYFFNGSANVGAKPIGESPARISVACRVPAYAGCYALLPKTSLKTADEVDPLKISGATID